MNFSQSCDSRPFYCVYNNFHVRSSEVKTNPRDDLRRWNPSVPRQKSMRSKKVSCNFYSPEVEKKYFLKPDEVAKEQMSKHNSCNEIIDLLISLTQFIFDSFENKTIDKKRPSFDRRLKGFHFWWNSLVHITYDLFWFSIFFDIVLSRTETTKRKQIADDANQTVEFQTLNWIDFVSICHLRFSIRQVQIRIWNCNHQ